ncbi:hypothetical protein D9758_009493 [Tetrapyrgos nigripes]|uniref:AMP-dependent synthetase/ligase domain-containing protein n=1 Tax=Tetrapyrgos nigripes TaxID=182062 RepID=A0A8H5G172_9AGAR|nr:hypothetical protein D9758_009493 [Tetrapyrgos nigripes]
MSFVPLSVSPATLPVDFLHQNGEDALYQYVDLDIADGTLLCKLSRAYPLLPVSRIYASALCATVFWITGQNSGALGLLSDAHQLVYYDIDSDTTPRDLTQTLSSFSFNPKNFGALSYRIAITFGPATEECQHLDVTNETADWNDTNRKSLEFSSIGDMFWHWADKIPGAMAVENSDGSLSLTYHQLDQWSGVLASWLVAQGHGGEKETIIGVWQIRSAMLVVTYLACLKAGCAYLPIKMNLPSERVRAMLTISGCGLVLGYGTPYDFPCKDVVQYMDLATSDMQQVLLHTLTTSAYLPSVTISRLSSLIFTSGSTGVPKAVMIQHICLLNFLVSEYKPLNQGDRVAMILNIAFDVSSGEIWYPLAHGATLICHMRPYNAPFDVKDLSSFLEEKAINSFDSSTAVLRSLVEARFFEKELPSLRSVGLAGEAVFLAYIGPILNAKPNIILINNYGPSECTIYATTFTIPSSYNQANVAIGRTMKNIGAYVVDSDFKPVPLGVCGELLLTGKSLARGYMNREDLTSERFIWLGEDHYFGNLRAYRTGDLVHQTASGELEFIRRVEQGQVKLRGYRVELGEVERSIEQHPLVKAAVAVVCHHGESDDRLIAYFTADGNELQEFPEALKT